MTAERPNGGTRTITLILSAASVAVPLVAGAAAFMQQQINNSERMVGGQVSAVAAIAGAVHERVSALEVARLEAAELKGGADRVREANVAAISQLQGESRALDERLQREMRDLNTAIIVEGRAVDARLQGEISNLNEHLLEHVQQSEDRFLRLEEFLADRAERISHLEERLRSVERDVYNPAGSDSED